MSVQGVKEKSAHFITPPIMHRGVGIPQHCCSFGVVSTSSNDVTQ